MIKSRLFFLALFVLLQAAGRFASAAPKNVPVPFTEQDIRFAAAQGDTNRLVEMIKLKPEWVDKADQNGWTSLHEAARGGDVQVAKLIIDAGADLGARTKTGQTALKLANDNLGEFHAMTKLLKSSLAEELRKADEMAKEAEAKKAEAKKAEAEKAAAKRKEEAEKAAAKRKEEAEKAAAKRKEEAEKVEAKRKEEAEKAAAKRKEDARRKAEENFKEKRAAENAARRKQEEEGRRAAREKAQDQTETKKAESGNNKEAKEVVDKPAANQAVDKPTDQANDNERGRSGQDETAKSSEKGNTEKEEIATTVVGAVYSTVKTASKLVHRVSTSSAGKAAASNLRKAGTAVTRSAGIDDEKLSEASAYLAGMASSAAETASKIASSRVVNSAGRALQTTVQVVREKAGDAAVASTPFREMAGDMTTKMIHELSASTTDMAHKVVDAVVGTDTATSVKTSFEGVGAGIGMDTQKAPVLFVGVVVFTGLLLFVVSFSLLRRCRRGRLVHNRKKNDDLVNEDQRPSLERDVAMLEEGTKMIPSAKDQDSALQHPFQLHHQFTYTIRQRNSGNSYSNHYDQTYYDVYASSMKQQSPGRGPIKSARFRRLRLLGVSRRTLVGCFVLAATGIVLAFKPSDMSLGDLYSFIASFVQRIVEGNTTNSSF